MTDVKLAWQKAIAQRKNREFQKSVISRKKNITLEDRLLFIGTEDFKQKFEEAYRNKGSRFRDVGISYRVNPVTGENEMFIAGSQGALDWMFNLSNALFYGSEKYASPFLDALFSTNVGFRAAKFRPKLSGRNPDRWRQELGIAREARKRNIDVMYGHSRGGALVADADFDGLKYGLDAAMIIAENPDMVNFMRSGLFDATLGLSGMKNVVVDTGHGIHWAYGPKT